ncbi:MAG: hypothetical protein Q8P51_02080 [Ignavibacteria bacterium]|nr:hypothetical protein [Ignavibacteria bacterium]
MGRTALLLFLCFQFVSVSSAQEGKAAGVGQQDPSHSVYGPPRPAIWEFQLSQARQDAGNISSFNFYRKDQRNKTLFFKVSDNGLNNRSEFRVKEVTGGAVLFPVNDDDRYQLDLGGTYDRVRDTSLYGRALFSRMTYRPRPNLWFRAGGEYFDGYTTGRSAPYRTTILNAYYFAGKITIDRFSLIALLGKGRMDDAVNTRIGLAGSTEGPFNTFFMAGYIRSDEPKENVRTLALGRWAPFRPDQLPSAVLIWKHRESYDFVLGGLFWGKTNLLVKPAIIGMSQGMYISSAALRENSELRQGQLMSITDDYRNSDITLFYVFLNQGIEMMPGNISHVGFRAIQLFKIFGEVEFAPVSKPVLGVFYNEETEPAFNPSTRRFVDKESTFWSYQAGFTLKNMFILNVIHTPQKSEWTVALSFVAL